MHEPAYGTGKSGVGKMATTWPTILNPTRSRCVHMDGALKDCAVFAAQTELYASVGATAESPEFTDRVIDALAQDSELIRI